MKHLPLILLALFLVVPLPAQTRPQLKKQLRAMISQAKKDTALLFEAATFAKDNDFTTDYKRLISKILKIDKDHAGANHATGRVKHNGNWIAEADYKKLLAAELEAKYKAEGKVRVGGVWVDKEHVADAKKGVFHHDDELVNKWQMQQFQLGKVRHPRTGAFIKATDLKKAEEGLILLKDGRWVTVEDADKFHSDKARPWTFRSKYFYVVSTVKLAEIEKTAALMDVGAGTLFKIFGHGSPAPTKPALVFMAKTTEDYRGLGQEFGTGDDAYGVYIAGGNTPASAMRLQGGKARLVIMNYGEPTTRTFFARHAAGLALCQSFFGDEIDDLPSWFVRGIASYSARFQRERDIKYLGKLHEGRGGVRPLRDWFGDFKITMDVSRDDEQANIFQAGLLIAFCLKGGDKRATSALMRVTKACQKGSRVGPAVENLEKVLTSRQKQVKAYFATVIK